MTKLQLTLTDQETALLQGYGLQFGYSLPKIARFFLSKATEKILEQGITPVYEMSAETEKNGLDALKDLRSGKTTKVENIDDYFSKL